MWQVHGTQGTAQQRKGPEREPRNRGFDLERRGQLAARMVLGPEAGVGPSVQA